MHDSLKHKRFFGLDIFRAFAIMLVVLLHGDYLLDKTRFNDFHYLIVADGVDLFFVLSGFLIGNILLKEINSKVNFGFNDLLKFWKRRWFRTLPNYYLILLLNCLVVYHKIIIEDIHQFNWKFIFFLQNFSHPFYGFFWESWSLAIEEWFYVLAPLLLLLFLKLTDPKKSFFITTIIMIIAPFIYRMVIMNPEIDYFTFDITFRKLVLTRLDSIAYGLLAAWFYYYYQINWNKYKYTSFLLGVLLVVILNLLKLENTFYKQVLYFSVVPFSLMLLLPLTQNIKTAKGMMANAITHISKISYSMYLLHLALISEVIRDNFTPTNETDSLIKYILYWLILIISSTLLYKYYEKPMMNLRDKI